MPLHILYIYKEETMKKNSFKKIAALMIAAAMIGMESGSLETHEYLGKLKEEKDRSFQQTYEHYTQQFSL